MLLLSYYFTTTSLLLLYRPGELQLRQGDASPNYYPSEDAMNWVHSSVVGAADCRSAGPWFKSGCAFIVTRKFRTQSTIFYERKSSKPRHPPRPKAFSPVTFPSYVSNVEAWQSNVIRNHIFQRDMSLRSPSSFFYPPIAETSARPALITGCP